MSDRGELRLDSRRQRPQSLRNDIVLKLSSPLTKPNQVLIAEYALWAWTVWTCVFGIVEAWHQIPQVEDLITGNLQGMVSIDANSMMKWVIYGYVGLAAASGWVVYKIGQGKHWARSTTLWGFVLQIGIMVIPPYNTAMEYLMDIPDVGLQLVALHFLYTQPSRAWFEKP